MRQRFTYRDWLWWFTELIAQEEARHGGVGGAALESACDRDTVERIDSTKDPEAAAAVVFAAARQIPDCGETSADSRPSAGPATRSTTARLSPGSRATAEERPGSGIRSYRVLAPEMGCRRPAAGELHRRRSMSAHRAERADCFASASDRAVIFVPGRIH
jgi:hypothetical protein